MSEAAGTLEVIAIELSKLLKPLESDLTPARAPVLFAQLGFVLSPAQVSGLSGQASTIVSNVTQLANIIPVLISAIEAEDFAVLLQKSGEAIGKIKNIIDGFSPLANSIPGLTAEDRDKIPTRLFNYLLATYLGRAPGLNEVLQLMGLLKQELKNPGSSDPANPEYILSTYNFSQLGGWLSNPRDRLETLYDWGNGTFDGTKLFPVLEKVLLPTGLPVLYDETIDPSKLDLAFFEIVPKTDLSPRGMMIKLKGDFPPFTQTIDLNGGSKMEVKVDFQLPLNTGLVIQPNGNIFFQPPNGNPGISGDVLLRFTIKPPNPLVVLGQAGGSRFEIGEMIFTTQAKLAWNAGENKASGKYKFEGALNKCKVLINTGEADGFLKSLLPGLNMQADFDLSLGITSDGKLYFGGSSALEIELPLHIQLGPVSFDGITLGVGFADGKIPVSLGANITGALGPITVTTQGIGVEARFSFPPNNNGNLGAVQLDFAFKPPKGVGISVDASIVKGGGFLVLDPDKGEYAGALELSISNTLQVAAIGIINTKMPDGTEGFSLLIIISVQFSPGIALGMGFFLSGLGGMLGIHRTINVDSLREGVKNNAIDHIMFPENVVANMNTLLPQIKGIFPIKKDQFIIGLMARITWGVPSLVTVDFGIAIEFSSPVRLAILGVLKIVLPTEDAAVLRLQVNFVGIIDFDKGYLSFDASIYNSRILTFTLEGDMALRISWGATKAFLMSVGGFHPAFRPPQSLNVPALKRLSLTILSGNPNLVLTCYFAVTSNTVQFGAKIDFRFSVSEFKVLGYLYFDVLFQFSPFKFIANIGAGLEVKLGSTTLFSITLDFELSGPTPWNARGTASFSILFFTIKVRFNVTWGDAQEVISPSIPVLPKVIEAFTLDANWTTELPSNRVNLVTLASVTPADGELILQSFGALKVSQTVMPLNLVIDKFGDNKPQDIKKADIASFKLGGVDLALQETREAFAPAVFKKLSDADKLKSPSYTQEKGGAKISDTNTLFMSYGLNRDVTYDVKISDFDPFPDPPAFEIDMSWFRKMTRGGAVGKSALSVENKQKGFKLKNSTDITEERFVLVDNATLSEYSVDSFGGGSHAEAIDMLDNLIRKDPALRGKVSVASAYHLAL